MKKLHKIIDCAPPVDREFIVFRGQRCKTPDEYLKTDQINKIQGMYSTSISATVTDIFTNTNNLFRIFVPKGTKCLWVAPISTKPYEAEILIDHGTLIKFVDQQISDQIYITTSTIINNKLE